MDIHWVRKYPGDAKHTAVAQLARQAPCSCQLLKLWRLAKQMLAASASKRSTRSTVLLLHTQSVGRASQSTATPSTSTCRKLAMRPVMLAAALVLDAQPAPTSATLALVVRRGHARTVYVSRRFNRRSPVSRHLSEYVAEQRYVCLMSLIWPLSWGMFRPVHRM